MSGYEERYEFDTWDLDTPSVCAMETDADVYIRDGAMVPTGVPANETCLHDVGEDTPLYTLPMYDVTHITPGEVRILPKQYNRLPLRVRRFDFRNTDSVAATLFSSGCDGLVVLPNHNFVGGYSSEIGHGVGVYNSSDVDLIHGGILNASPVCVLFDVLPPWKKFEAVTVRTFPSKITMPPKSRHPVQLVDEREVLVDKACVFYPSIGACEIPEGVFMDDIADGTLTIFNTTNATKELVFREEDDDCENFLGYAVLFKDNTKIVARQADVLKVDLDNSPLHFVYMFNTKSTYSIRPGDSQIVVMTSATVINTRDKGTVQLNTGHTDHSLQLIRYAKLVSVVSGLKVITPVLDGRIHKKQNPVSVSFLNISSETIVLRNGQTAVAAIVSQAAKLTGKGAAGR